MNVLINGVTVDFSLEREKSLKELVQYFLKWAAERGLVLTELSLDGKDPVSPEDVHDRELSAIDSIDCTVLSRSEVALDIISGAAAYCSRAVDYIDSVHEGAENDYETASGLASGLEWLVEVLERLLNLIGTDKGSFKFRDREVQELISAYRKEIPVIAGLRNADDFGREFAGPGSGSVFGKIREILEIIYRSEELRLLIIKSIDSPDKLVKSLKSLRESFNGELEKIKSASAAFQSGKDSAGSAGLDDAVSFISEYMRTCSQAAPVFGLDFSAIEINSISLESRNMEIHEILSGIVDVMENDDIVGLSDILEYELVPALEGMDLYIDLILEKI